MKEGILFWSILVSMLGCLAPAIPGLSFTDLQNNFVVVKKREECVPPYSRVGKQCLFFSRPYQPWGISTSWDEAYKNVYDAALFCIERGGKLAQKVEDFQSAKKHCLEIRGSCAPSLIARDGVCYQWSPIDGSELELPCELTDLKARFICQQT